MKVELAAFVDLEWLDLLLVFNGTADGGCFDETFVPPDKWEDIWAPDVYVANAIDTDCAGVLRLRHDGAVTFSRRAVVELECPMDFSRASRSTRRCAPGPRDRARAPDGGVDCSGGGEEGARARVEARARARWRVRARGTGGGGGRRWWDARARARARDAHRRRPGRARADARPRVRVRGSLGGLAMTEVTSVEWSVHAGATREFEEALGRHGPGPPTSTRSSTSTSSSTACAASSSST